MQIKCLHTGRIGSVSFIHHLVFIVDIQLILTLYLILSGLQPEFL